MVDRVKRCSIADKMWFRLHHFFCVFDLRQGAILIAVHQIALSSFILIILLVGISHAGEMLSMLQNDMEDDAERRGFYEVQFGDQLVFHEADVVSTNNQRRFVNAQHLASATVIFLYTSTILTSIYLMSCIALLYGAVKRKREYMVAWIACAAIVAVLMVVAVIYGDTFPCIVNLFGGHSIYHSTCALFVMTFVYAIAAVTRFAIDTGKGSCARSVTAGGSERGERLLLLDHAAHSSLLSSAQLSKLSQGTRTQFV